MNAWNKERRTLVARLDSMGDVLLAGPAVRAVAARSEVTMLVSSRGAAAARMLPGVSRVVVWDCPWVLHDGGSVDDGVLGSLTDAIGDRLPERAVILTSFHQSPLPLALLLRMAGVGLIAGASTDHAGPLLDRRLVPGEDFPEDQPEALRAVAIAEHAGFPAVDDHGLSVRIPERAKRARDMLPGRYVVVHPGASAPARAWPARHAAEAVRELTRRGHRVVVTGGPDERELTARVCSGTAIDLGGRLSLPELAAVLEGADAVVVANTGPAHLAAAVGTAVVSLFAPVVPAARWAPWGVPHVLLGDQRALCADTRATRCPIAGHPCLASVSGTQAADACDRLLGTAGAPLVASFEGATA